MSAGLHYSDAILGRVFSQSPTPLGLALPLYTTKNVCDTGICGVPIWNPPGSNRNVELISADFTSASGTAVYGAVGLMAMPLSVVGTGYPCTAFASSTPLNALVGAGNASKCLSYNGAAATSVVLTAFGLATLPTATAAGWVRGLACINADVGGLHGPLVPHYDFQGTCIVPPGWMVYFACTLASVALFATSVVWKEIPIAAGQG